MDSLALFFFFLQQLGICLGVGSSTFAVMFYIIGSADGTIDQSERAFMHAVYTTLRIGLFLIIASGAAITGAHLAAGDMSLVESPVFLFKWLLLGVLVINGMLMKYRIMNHSIGGPIAGGSWYALFFVHTLAINLNWEMLFTLYTLWLILFALAFRGLTRFAIDRHQAHMQAAVPTVPVPTGPRIEFTLGQTDSNPHETPRA